LPLPLKAASRWLDMKNVVAEGHSINNGRGSEGLGHNPMTNFVWFFCWCRESIAYKHSTRDCCRFENCVVHTYDCMSTVHHRIMISTRQAHFASRVYRINICCKGPGVNELPGSTTAHCQLSNQPPGFETFNLTDARGLIPWARQVTWSVICPRKFPFADKNPSDGT